MIKIFESSDRRQIDRLIEPRKRRDRALEARVAAIVGAVRREGDRALIRYARRFDGLDGPLELSVEEMRAEARRLAPDVRRAIAAAARHIRAVARRQLPRAWRMIVAPGIRVEQRVAPLDRVGCYVPGGRHALPSSLLMTAIPAAIAGVPEIIAVCPRPEPAVLAAALEAGVTRLFRIGGAQAIAALAYGTRTIPAVDKIVGPGSRWVAAAKSAVAADCAIDFYAGPTEIVVVADTGPPAWIAADLIAQAEHDPEARAILVTASRRLARAVARSVAAQLPRRGPARTALARHGGVIVAADRAEAAALANRMSPEHLVCDDERVAAWTPRAASTFVGRYTAQVAGDYAIGSNHVLPTAKAARARGGLTAADFVRVTSIQRLTRAGLARLAPTVVTLARAEGLEAHARSIEIRLSAQRGARGLQGPRALGVRGRRPRIKR